MGGFAFTWGTKSLKTYISKGASILLIGAAVIATALYGSSIGIAATPSDSKYVSSPKAVVSPRPGQTIDNLVSGASFEVPSPDPDLSRIYLPISYMAGPPCTVREQFGKIPCPTYTPAPTRIPGLKATQTAISANATFPAQRCARYRQSERPVAGWLRGLPRPCGNG